MNDTFVDVLQENIGKLFFNAQQKSVYELIEKNVGVPGM